MSAFKQLATFFMTILVVMPVCLCGHSLIPEQIEQEHSCCPNHHEEDESSECEYGCDSSHHAQKQFISVQTEVELSELESDPQGSLVKVTVSYLSSAHHLSAHQLPLPPPKLLAFSVHRRITFCTYLL